MNNQDNSFEEPLLTENKPESRPAGSFPSDNTKDRLDSEIRELAHDEATGPSFIPKRNAKEDADYQKAMTESGPYLTLGLQLAGSLAAFAGIGWWIDSVNNSSPLWLGIMSGGGAVLSLTYFIMTTLRLSKLEETKRVKK
ncbi:MAG: AtpZ/AtpI family protein [Candidatus Kapaibacterium sp.]|jgi:F0F1-type ATP synthase assembly protein I